jgi:hypothetical protein
VSAELALGEGGVVGNRLVEQEELRGDAVGDLLPEAVGDPPGDVGPEAVDERRPLVDHIEHPRPDREGVVVQVRDALPVEVVLRGLATGEFRPLDVGDVVLGGHPAVVVGVVVDAAGAAGVLGGTLAARRLVDRDEE